MREVDVPRMRRHVRTLGHVAHVAEITVVDDLGEVLPVDAVELSGLGLVDEVEQRRKGVAEVEAAAAAVADVEDPLELLLEGGRFVEFRVLPTEGMARGRFETALAALRDRSVGHSESPDRR